MFTRRLVPLVALLAVAACRDDVTAPIDPQPLPGLEDQVWHVHVSDGQPLPALLGHRLLPGSVLEQDFLDSARIEIAADGSWEHKAWYQRFRDTRYHTSVSTLDWGTWTATPTGYDFRRNTGELLYTIAGAIGSELRLTLRYPNQEGVAVSTLRRTAAPLSVAGRWRATALNGTPLPATLYGDLNEPRGDGSTFSWKITIDSIGLQLYANGHYVHRIFYSEYQGVGGEEPTVLFRHFYEGDFGSFVRSDAQLSLTSGWISGFTKTGTAAATGAGSIVLNHGISHRDPPAAFRYERW